MSSLINAGYVLCTLHSCCFIVYDTVCLYRSNKSKLHSKWTGFFCWFECLLIKAVTNSWVSFTILFRFSCKSLSSIWTWFKYCLTMLSFLNEPLSGFYVIWKVRSYVFLDCRLGLKLFNADFRFPVSKFNWGFSMKKTWIQICILKL